MVQMQITCVCMHLIFRPVGSLQHLLLTFIDVCYGETLWMTNSLRDRFVTLHHSVEVANSFD